MSLNAKAGVQKKNDFPEQKVIEPGTYPARLVQVIDLGLQPQRAFKGEAKAPAHEIMFTYELVDEFMQDEQGNDIEDKPRWISETLPFFGLFADKAKSTKRILTFDPTGQHDGQVGEMVSAPVNVTLVNNKSGDKIYTNVVTTTGMRPRDAAACPELVNPTKVFDTSNPDMEVFGKLPKWIQDKIKANLEYEGSNLKAIIEGANEAVGKPAKEAEAPKKPKKARAEKEVEPERDNLGDGDDEVNEDAPW